MSMTLLLLRCATFALHYYALSSDNTDCYCSAYVLRFVVPPATVEDQTRRGCQCTHTFKSTGVHKRRRLDAGVEDRVLARLQPRSCPPTAAIDPFVCVHYDQSAWICPSCGKHSDLVSACLCSIVPFFSTNPSSASAAETSRPSPLSCLYGRALCRSHVVRSGPRKPACFGSSRCTGKEAFQHSQTFSS